MENRQTFKNYFNNFDVLTKIKMYEFRSSLISLLLFSNSVTNAAKSDAVSPPLKLLYPRIPSLVIAQILEIFLVLTTVLRVFFFPLLNIK